MSLSRTSLFATVLLAVILGISVLAAVNLTFHNPETVEKVPGNGTENVTGQQSLPRFASYYALETFVNTTGESVLYARDGSLSLPAAPPSVAKSTTAEQKTTSFSQTNIQVGGVDEADIVKTDGTYIYTVSGENVTIVKAYPPKEAQVTSSISLGGTIAGLLVSGNKLVIFSNSYPNIYPTTKLLPQIMPFAPASEKTTIRVYNVKNKANPRLVRTVDLDGNYFDSRMIGNYTYVITSQSAYIFNGNVTLPTVKSNGMVEKIEATDIYYSNVTDYSYAFTTVAAINLKDDVEAPSHETFLFGYTGEIYVSPTNIYLASPSYFDSTQKTSIHRIHITNGKIVPAASGNVSGYVLNQFSMDEYGGYFRIATTTNDITRTSDQPATENSVYVLDSNLAVVGKVEKLAPGERIYSARFMGTRCYLVTFKKIDPLFVINLADPANPSVLGKLKIPGYSDYLQPYDDNHLIGIGKNTVDAEQGDFAWYQGIKISMFDVSDVANPKEVASYSIGDRGTDSPALSDHKALLFDKTRNILALPILLAKINESTYPNGVPPNAYGEYVWQGLYVLNVNTGSITLKGRITHMDNTQDFMKSGYYFSSDYTVERSLYINDTLYTLSAKKILLNNLADLSEISQIKLP